MTASPGSPAGPDPPWPPGRSTLPLELRCERHPDRGALFTGRAMATKVVVQAGAGQDVTGPRSGAVERAMEVFQGVDRACTGFRADSPLMRANRSPARWHLVPEALFCAAHGQRGVASPARLFPGALADASSAVRAGAGGPRRHREGFGRALGQRGPRDRVRPFCRGRRWGLLLCGRRRRVRWVAHRRGRPVGANRAHRRARPPRPRGRDFFGAPPALGRGETAGALSDRPSDRFSWGKGPPFGDGGGLRRGASRGLEQGSFHRRPNGSRPAWSISSQLCWQ